MNEFERAMAKTEKREQRKTMHMPEPVILNDCPAVADIPVPKEKSASIDAVIRVTVTLPYDTFELSFTKPNVLGMRRLTKLDFQRAITDGLKSILGGVK
jgi:hypothetical protein